MVNRPTRESRLHWEVTHAIIWAFYQIYDRLGFGFLEAVYKRALVHELTKRGVRVRTEALVEAWYDSICLGYFRADLLVEDVVVVEVKAAEAMPMGARPQLINYLRATDLEVGLLLNFGLKPQFQRVVHTNTLKKHRIEP